MGDPLIRRAEPPDVAAITGCVTAAYGHYVARIGKPPGPMLDDYGARLRSSEVWVAEARTQAGAPAPALLGVLVLSITPAGFLLDNIAVAPAAQGRGVGRALLDWAERRARAAGCSSIHLYTHERMVENLALYQRIGYVAYDRRTEAGFARVYLRKRLDPCTPVACDQSVGS